MKRCCFRKKQVWAIKRKISVDLIGRHLVIASDTVFATGIHQASRAENVGLQKHFRIFNRAVDVTFGGKVHDRIGVLLLKEFVNGFAIANIHLTKAKVRIL